MYFFEEGCFGIKNFIKLNPKEMVKIRNHPIVNI